MITSSWIMLESVDAQPPGDGLLRCARNDGGWVQTVVITL